MLTEAGPGAARRLATGAALCAALAAGACASSGGLASQSGRAPSMPSTPPPQIPDAPHAPSAPALEQRDARLRELLARASASATAENLAAAAYRYYELGVRDAALQLFLASLKADPGFVPALDGAARVWRDGGRSDAALGSAHRATYYGPRSPEAWNTLGTVLQSLALEAEAAAAYRHAIDLDGSAAYARSNLCYLDFLRGDHGAAIAECSAAATADRGFAPAANNLALAYAAAGKSDLAFATFAAAGGEAVAHYNIGIVQLAARRYVDAIQAFEAAYRADPAFDQAWTRAREARRLNLQAETTNANPRR